MQRVTGDVDFRIMVSTSEIVSSLHFLRLNTTWGARIPPAITLLLSWKSYLAANVLQISVIIIHAAIFLKLGIRFLRSTALTQAQRVGDLS